MKDVSSDEGCIFSFVPPEMRNSNSERRLRITVDDSRSAASIRDEVLQRKGILPEPWKALGGGVIKSQTGFELDDKDLVRYVSRLFAVHMRR